jgi:threonine dehydrogenase-like Zn-dependent dehydrogenase
MPLALIADRAGHAVLKTYDEPSLPPDQIRVRSLFSAVKHGTEGRGFMHNTLDASDRWDGQLRLHRRGEPLSDVYPKPLGNMCVGIVTEIGCQIRDLQVGDRVMGHLPIRETHTLTTSKVRPVPENVSPQALMYWDPADFALGGIRDGGVRPGDRVAVFGLGAIGQMVAQIARIAGARWIAAIDLIEKRREAAARHGADIILDPSSCDAGLEIKLRTEHLGVDVTIETSGASAALNDALRATKYNGTVVSTAYYAGAMDRLFLSGEWHRNRINIISSRANSDPQADYGWDFKRIQKESLQLIVEGRIQADDLIDPIVPITQAADAYHAIFEHPERSIKLGIDHYDIIKQGNTFSYSCSA